MSTTTDILRDGDTTITFVRARRADMIVQEHIFAARGPGVGPATDLVLQDEHDGRWVVRWNVTRGRSWARGWRRTFTGANGAAEAAARAFMNRKHVALLAWLAKAEAQRPAPVDVVTMVGAAA